MPEESAAPRASACSSPSPVDQALHRAAAAPRARVRRVDRRVDPDPLSPRLVLVLVGGLDEHRQVVQERPLRRLDVALEQLDERTAVDALAAGLAAEPEPLVLERGRLGVRREQRQVVEVVLD
jgi:hypothetical protein